MKQFSNIIILIAVIVCLVSCNLKNKKDDALLESQDKEAFTSGKWHITGYKTDGKDKKERYTGFSFIFSKDNHITGTKKNSDYKGNWSILKGDITDDAPAADLDFIIEFNTQDDLSHLNGRWMIRDRTFSTLRLSNNENYLIFEKS